MISTGRIPSVSIIIVNWNGEPFLEGCFRALEAQSFRDFEVVFVDNASADNSVSTTKKLSSKLGFPLLCIELPGNTGFTGGNTEGLKHCSGNYIALLNNDTIVTKGWLEALVKAMDNHPEVGLCASKLIVAETDIIDSAGDYLSTSLRAFKRGEGCPATMYTTEEYVFGACAGAALYRREMLNEIGFFDEDFFLIFEDADLNFRAQLAGWKCLYVPDAIVHHRVSASLKRLGESATFHSVKNDKAVVIKNAPWQIILRNFSVYFIEEFCFSLLFHAKEGRFQSYIKGNLNFLKNLPRYLNKRKQVMKLKKVPASYISDLLVSVWPIYKRKIRSRLASLFSRHATDTTEKTL